MSNISLTNLKNLFRTKTRQSNIGVGVYLDYVASTPTDKKVKRIMDKCARTHFANPGSIHKGGVAAKKIIENARKNTANFFGALPDEIVFVSGGTEANNLAILGVFESLVGNGEKLKDLHAITSAIEHHSVLNIFENLEKKGLSVSYIAVDKNGIIDTRSLKDALRVNTVLVSVMYVNNEIGAIQPINEIAKVLRRHRKRTTNNRQQITDNYPVFHTDAAQALLFCDIGVKRLGVDMLSASGSKVYGPKGSGSLYIRRGSPHKPVSWGGGQEKGVRPGTENTCAIAGYSKALDVAENTKEKEKNRLQSLRNFFIKELKDRFPSSILHGGAEVVPNIINISFPNIDNEELVLRLDAKGISCATRSACSSMDEQPSHVVSALDADAYPEFAVRFSMGRETNRRSIVYTLKALESNIKLMNDSS